MIYYQSLIHEYLDFHLNRVKVTDASSPSGKPVEQYYDLDSRYQEFWSVNRGKAFPDVAAEVKNEVTSYRGSCDEISKYNLSNGNLDIGSLNENDLSEKGLNQFIGRYLFFPFPFPFSFFSFLSLFLFFFIALV